MAQWYGSKMDLQWSGGYTLQNQVLLDSLICGVFEGGSGSPHFGAPKVDVGNGFEVCTVQLRAYSIVGESQELHVLGEYELGG